MPRAAGPKTLKAKSPMLLKKQTISSKRVREEATPEQVQQETFVVHDSVVTDEPSRLVSQLDRYLENRHDQSSSDSSSQRSSSFSSSYEEVNHQDGTCGLRKRARVHQQRTSHRQTWQT